MFCLSILRMEQLGLHYKDIHEIWYMSICLKSVEKIYVLLKSDKNDDHFTWAHTHVYNISLNS